MADRDSNIVNYFETKLSGSFGPTDLTANVDSTTDAPSSPCYVVIEPQNASQREVIYMDGTFTSTTFVTTTLDNRYLAGSAVGSGLTHPSGSVVWVAVLAQHLEDVHDRIDAIGTGPFAELSGATFTGPVLLPDGTAAAPGIAFASTDSGIWRATNTALRFAIGGTNAYQMEATVFRSPNDADKDLGAATQRFKSLYLSGDVKDSAGNTKYAPTASGSYTGDGTSSRTIPLSFTPKTVTIWEAGSFTQFLNDAGAHEHDNTGAFGNSTTSKTTTGGFIVTTGANNNISSTTYRYVAIG